MSTYEIGYGKVPKHSQFKKGVSGNPAGRPKAEHLKMAAIISSFLEESVEYTERSQLKTATRRELTIRKLIAEALRGDVKSAASLLDLRQHAEKFGTCDEIIIKVIGGLPPKPGSDEDVDGHGCGSQPTSVKDDDRS